MLGPGPQSATERGAAPPSAGGPPVVPPGSRNASPPRGVPPGPREGPEAAEHFVVLYSLLLFWRLDASYIKRSGMDVPRMSTTAP